MRFKIKNRKFGKIEQFIIAVPRWLLRLAVIVIIVPVILGGLRNCQGNIDVPPAGQAPWVIQAYIYNDDGTRAPSRFYLGEYYSTQDGVPALKGYWDFDGRTYEYHNDVKQFPPEEYGSVDIIRRK